MTKAQAGHGAHTEHLEVGDASGDNVERGTAGWAVFTDFVERKKKNTFQEVGGEGEMREIWMEKDENMMTGLGKEVE